MRISARTALTAVIGSPVRHSLSPPIHNAGFEARGIDRVMVALEVAPGELGDAIRGVRALGLTGVSVTMPHKSDVIDLLDEVSERAARLGAVNCVTSREGRLVGDNTDGAGFVAALREDLHLEPRGLDCVVLGAGGAARAVVSALAIEGARSVAVVNRSVGPAEAAAALAGAAGVVGRPEDAASADLVVNATPVGMGGDGSVPLDPALLGPGQAVVDLIYHPLRTRWLDAAGERGAVTANGLSMLVHQAAIAFEGWTGVAAPVAAMRAGALAALGASSTHGSEGPAKS